MKLRLSLISALLVWSTPAAACDLCAIHNDFNQRVWKPGDLSLSLSEQYTRYDRLQQDGNHLPNDAHQYLESSITQINVGYGATESIALQLTAPIISRRFRTIEDGEAVKDDEAGLGDITVLARYLPYRSEGAERSLIISLAGGIKLPTGDTDPLREDAADGQHAGEDAHGEGDEHQRLAGLLHGGEVHGPASAIHGHDVALGSGSVDYLIGTGMYARYQRVFFLADVQYLIRTEGDYDYRYANDLLWQAGPAVYVYLSDEGSAALHARLSGEYKEKDRANGADEDDTALTSLFIGPALSVLIGDRLSAEAGVDLPAYMDSSGTQATASYRVRAALSYRF